MVNSLNLSVSRENRGISLEDIAEATKISIRFLRAIEEEDFETLPGGIFNTSYLRQYASTIGIEPSTLLAHYHRVTNPMPAATDQPSSRERTVSPRRFFKALSASRL
jgi:cytoskeletal protein RodZ